MIASGQKILQGIKAASWQQTVGYLSSVENINTSTDVISSEVRVCYSYTVDGREYQGNTIHTAYGSSSFYDAHRGLESLLKPAKKIRVYYDPENPQKSMLSPGFYSCSLAILFGGFIFFSFGFGLLLVFWFTYTGNQNFALGILIISFIVGFLLAIWFTYAGNQNFASGITVIK